MQLKELNDEIAMVYSCVIVLLFHSVPTWNAGDYLVESNGDSFEWYFSRSKFLATIDSYFDYKHERQDKLDKIIEIRKQKVEF